MDFDMIHTQQPPPYTLPPARPEVGGVREIRSGGREGGHKRRWRRERRGKERKSKKAALCPPACARPLGRRRERAEERRREERSRREKKRRQSRAPHGLREAEGGEGIPDGISPSSLILHPHFYFRFSSFLSVFLFPFFSVPVRLLLLSTKETTTKVMRQKRRNTRWPL